MAWVRVGAVMTPKKITLTIGTQKSDISIGAPLAQLPEVLKAHAVPGTRIAVLADAGVPRGPVTTLMAGLKSQGFEALLIPVASGERSKTLAQAGRLYRQLAKAKFERKSWIIAVGGGVTGDLAGFVAATYMRGIPLVQVPTTLLAQVDASIGGKTAIDIPEGKNLVGAFYFPRLVWIDPLLLKSLPRRHWVNGAAEVIKYGAILDAKLFAELEATMDVLAKGWTPAWAPIIARCAQLKSQLVQKDPTETLGIRALLNFGHTVGHAVEAAGGYDTYLHGEAISIGMFVAGYLSSCVSGLSDIDRIRLGTLLTKAGLPARVKKALPRDTILSYLARDKKVDQGSVKFVLLKAIGKAVSGQTIPEEILDAGLSSSGL
jgi:3-dehydroquinate synthase